MQIKDARSLSSSAQEDLRKRVIRAVREGMRQVQAAAVFKVSRASVNKWSRLHEEHGSKGLTGRKRGRPARPRLVAADRARAIRWIVGRGPDQLRLPFALWTREAVQQLLKNEFGVEVSVWTVGRYLKAWGMTPQKPVRRAFEQNPAEVRHWLQTEYPTIERDAKRFGAQIHWGDEMGLRSDHQVGRTYGRRGKTPVILGTGQRFRCNMISTITNRGRLAFMVFEEGFRVKVFLQFLKRLVRHVKQRVFLIVDRHPVHRAAGVKRWLRKHEAKIQMFFLPSYSPELNPDEMLNQDVKSNALGRRRAWNKTELMGDVRGYLRSTQRQPNLVMSYFLEAHVHYAA
jgi:transposase